MTAPTRSDPRDLVGTVAIDMLADAYAGDEVFGMLPAEPNVEARFTCPGCHYRPWSGGTAVIRDAWRFDCHRCGMTGTRLLLERLVLEDHERLSRLYELIVESESSS